MRCLAALAAAGLAAVGASSATAAAPRSADSVTLTLVVYDSFPREGTSLNEALDRFTDDTGIGVDVLVAGDAGTMVSKAVLTAGNPEGDVMFGVDDTNLSRAVAGGVFEPYTADGIDAVSDELRRLVPDDMVTPVDFGDVCVNYDIDWFDEQGLAPPTTFEQLLDPEYEGLLVVPNPASSSPGLAFLLATIAHSGEDGWAEYWRALDDNDVTVVDGWTEAYYEQFTGSGGSPHPLVVSYGSSPPAEVIFADPPVDEPRTAIVESTCFRQVEFAGVLRGTDHADEAGQLVDFLISPAFQAEIPLNLFVYPANSDVELPGVFTDFAVVPDEPLTLDPAVVAEHREGWIEEWTDIVLR
ncbi:thiamine ABC transporter substrate-binding protein [soil metagenome]